MWGVTTEVEALLEVGVPGGCESRVLEVLPLASVPMVVLYFKCVYVCALEACNIRQEHVCM